MSFISAAIIGGTIAAGGAITGAAISAHGANAAASKQAAAIKAAAATQAATQAKAEAQPSNALLGLSNTQLAIGGVSAAAILIALSGRR
jgi:hypothetical protein